MILYSKKEIDVLNPKEEDINIIDIAHALSRICRYSGHCNNFLSVAHHSILVSCYLEDSYSTFMGRDVSLHGLLHDAPEAYLCDLPKDLKHSPALGGYRELEEKYENLILNKFLYKHSAPYPYKDIVKKADIYIQKIEKSLPAPDSIEQVNLLFLERFLILNEKINKQY